MNKQEDDNYVCLVYNTYYHTCTRENLFPGLYIYILYKNKIIKTMLESVFIKNNKNSPINYLNKINSFKNNKSFNFKSGINIIIGSNGSGKSTLIKLISMYTLCENSIGSEIPLNNMLNFPRLFYSTSHILNEKQKEEFYDGVEIKHDYLTKVFKLKLNTELKEYEANENLENFSLRFNNISNSVGEQTIGSIQHFLILFLIKLMIIVFQY